MSLSAISSTRWGSNSKSSLPQEQEAEELKHVAFEQLFHKIAWEQALFTEWGSQNQTPTMDMALTHLHEWRSQ